jgi:hypothetical protein
MDNMNKKQWNPKVLGDFLVKNGAICNSNDRKDRDELKANLRKLSRIELIALKATIEEVLYCDIEKVN